MKATGRGGDITIMADVDDNVFVYLGGDQVVPQDVTHVIIDQSVNIILRGAFQDRRQLVSVKFHDGVEVIEEDAFYGCRRLKKIDLKGVREIGQNWAGSIWKLQIAAKD
eukprot:scaffold3598_cov148-Skeletonema_dohrnii-CCMP3373.AAC.7